MAGKAGLKKNKWTVLRILEFLVTLITIIGFVFFFIDRTDALSFRVYNLEKLDKIRDLQYENIIEKLDELLKLHPRQ